MFDAITMILRPFSVLVIPRVVLLAVVAALLAAPTSLSVEAGGNDNFVDEESLVPNLPFGDVNVVVLTDVHSWLGSHRRQQPYYDVDLGDALSFWQRLKEHCDGNAVDETNGKCVDVFFVNNGDFVHGTGLSRVVDDQSDPEYIIPLLEKMPYDAVNVGNHELYDKRNTDYMIRPGGYVDWWGDRYLTSNIDKVSTENNHYTRESLGDRYKILRGRNSKVLAFGFLYNFRGMERGSSLRVEKIQSVVEEPWFADALTKEDYDAILVLAHMDLVDPLVEVLRAAIRSILGNDDEGTPVVFLTGHTHHRGVKQLEDLTMTFEAGKYMDTVGFVSFPKKESVRGKSGKDASSLFRHVFLDTNRKLLFEDTLGFSSFEDGQTEDGKELSDYIETTRQKLGLEEEIGCAPKSYFQNRRIDAPDSIWGLYRDEVVPKAFVPDKTDGLPTAMLLPAESWRYDLFSNSTLVVDDVYAIAPFNDTVVYLGTFSSEVILTANATLNGHHKHIGCENDNDNDGEEISLGVSWLLPRVILVGDVGKKSDPPSTKYHLYTHDYGKEKVQGVLKKIAPSEKVVLEKTSSTSSLIWLAYVRKHWPCERNVGRLRGSAPPQAEVR